MLQEFQTNYPNLSFWLFLTAVGLLFWGGFWARRFKCVPSDDHNPSEHHPWGYGLVLLGFFGLVVAISLGMADFPPDAQAKPDSESEVAKQD